MKLHVNFYPYSGRYLKFLGSLVLGIKIIFVVALLYTFILIREQEQQNLVLFEKYGQQKQIALKMEQDSEQSISYTELENLRQRVGQINHIYSQHRFDFDELFGALESALPLSVHLTHFSFDGVNGDTSIKAVTKNPDDITRFIEKLNDSEYIEDIVLLRKDSVKQHNQIVLQFTLKIVHAG